MQSRGSQAPVLAAFSPASAAREPVEFGIAASRLTGAPLVVVAVRRGGPLVGRLGGGDVEDAPDAARTLEHLRLDLDRRGLNAVELDVLEARTIGGGLSQAIEEHRPVLVVLGSAHRGAVGSVLLGSTAQHVLHGGTRPVAVVPKGYRRPEAGVAVVGGAFELGGEGAEALHSAAALAYSAGVRLRAITVGDPEQLADPEGIVRQMLGDIGRDLDLEVDVRKGDPADELVAASREVDLLVIGSRGRGARRAGLLGSVSSKVADHAACPVLILPPGAGELPPIETTQVDDAVKP
jgi:nucleotide-binding universal stress UspA family protein